MDWFWHALFIGLVVIPVTILWVATTIDILFRYRGSVLSRVAWILLVLVLPVIGAIIYLACRRPPDGEEVARIAEGQRTASVPAPSSPPRMY